MAVTLFEDDHEMRALSLSRPWPFAFVNGPPELQKRLENRSWAPPRHMIGRRIALHAANSWEAGAKEFIEDILRVTVPGKDECPKGQIFAVCSLAGHITSIQAAAANQKGWFMGPIAWVLEDLIALPHPIPCAGALGLWRVPSDIRTLVESQLG